MTACCLCGNPLTLYRAGGLYFCAAHRAEAADAARADNVRYDRSISHQAERDRNGQDYKMRRREFWGSRLGQAMLRRAV